MPNHHLNKVKVTSYWWKFVFVILLCFSFTLGGFKLYEKGNKIGCFNWSKDLFPIKLKTADNKQTKFIAVGDVGTGDVEQQKIADAMARVCQAEGCDFIILLGDNFYPDGVESVSDKQFLTKFENVYQDIEKPFYVILGNHDVKQSSYSQSIYSFQSKKWKMPNYEYAFSSSTSDFFAINTNCPLTWNRLRQKLVLTSVAEKNKLRKWLIVLGHHSIYSNGTHGDSNIFVRKFWQIFIDDQVDLYISGHNHQLAHLNLKKSETEFLISGAGGKNYRAFSEKEKLTDSIAKVNYSYSDNGFIWLNMNEKLIDVNYYNNDGKIIYHFIKNK